LLTKQRRNVSIELVQANSVTDRVIRPLLVRRLHVDLMRIFAAAC
jgi:hypothetical protein